MRRGLWFVAGAGAGVYAMVRVRRVKEAFTVDGLGDRWHAMRLGARMLRDEVAQGQAEAEIDLRERWGLLPHGTPQLTSGDRGSLVSLRDGSVLTSSGQATGSIGEHTQEGGN